MFSYPECAGKCMTCQIYLACGQCMTNETKYIPATYESVLTVLYTGKIVNRKISMNEQRELETYLEEYRKNHKV